MSLFHCDFKGLDRAAALNQWCCHAGDEDQAEEALTGVAEQGSSNALEAFLDSAPDPFKARPLGSGKVSSSHHPPAGFPVLRCCKGVKPLLRASRTVYVDAS